MDFRPSEIISGAFWGKIPVVGRPVASRSNVPVTSFTVVPYTRTAWCGYSFEPIFAHGAVPRLNAPSRSQKNAIDGQSERLPTLCLCPMGPLMTCALCSSLALRSQRQYRLRGVRECALHDGVARLKVYVCARVRVLALIIIWYVCARAGILLGDRLRIGN